MNEFEYFNGEWSKMKPKGFIILEKHTWVSYRQILDDENNGLYIVSSKMDIMLYSDMFKNVHTFRVNL